MAVVVCRHCALRAVRSQLAAGVQLRETEAVAEYCTCGAELPPDALFCHKCGKPQRELPAVELPPPRPSPVEKKPTVVVAPAREITFRNRAAVRSGLVAAMLAFLLTLLAQGQMAIAFLWTTVCLVGAGFFAVYLYRRRTGEDLSTRSGARLGWITGLFSFVLTTILFTIAAFVASAQGGFAAAYRKQLEVQGASAELDEMFRLLESPSGVATILFFTLLVVFFFSTLLPTLGGAMGAKVLEKE